MIVGFSPCVSMNRIAVVDVCPEEEATTGNGRTLITEIVGSSCDEWNLSNKYYKATLVFDLLGRQEKLPQKYQAVILLHDFHKSDSLKHVASYWSGQVDSSTEVQILVGVDASDRGPTVEGNARRKALDWCIEHGFELVMWKPDALGSLDIPDDSPGLLVDDDDENDSCEGVRRIKDALQAHVWPEMTMNTSKTPGVGSSKPKPSTEGPSTEQSGIAEQEETKKSKKLPTNEKFALLPDDLVSSGVLEEMCRDENEDDELESFERLFSQLPKMKETAANLPHEERLEYAEKVVMAFWKALGDGIEDDPEQSDESEDVLVDGIEKDSVLKDGKEDPVLTDCEEKVSVSVDGKEKDTVLTDCKGELKD